MKGDNQQAIFVVQKHDARTLHYDFRLEVEGVLVSWAVPKGPSLDPEEKRLAVPVEDHPLSYGNFEGVISEGQYGAGPVIVWDKGSYRQVTDKKDDPPSMRAALEEGKVEIWLEGHKLKGGFALVRAHFGGRDSDKKRPKWLLIKKDDEHARPGSAVTKERPESVKSQRTLEEVEQKE